MFLYRELFLAMIISLASITLADVLVQPGYQHQSDSNPRYSQPVPQYQINSLSEQYRTEQLPKQESPWYLPRVQNVQTVYPYYESDQDNSFKSGNHKYGYDHTAKRKQLLDHVTIYIPRNVQTRQKVLPCKTLSSTCNQPVASLGNPNPTEAPTETSTEAPIRESKSQNKNNEKLSGINENFDTSYSDRTSISLPFHFLHYPGNYPTYDYSKTISDWDEFSDNAEFCNRNSNSAYRINPSKIRIIPNYDDKYYTNINDPNNLAPKIPQTRSQSFIQGTYNYSPENIQAVSSDLKYDDNTYPSDTQLSDMFSSPVYY